MKTVKEWFEELPTEYREWALKEMTHPEAVFNKMSHALLFGIEYWEKTKEGIKFWNTVHEYYIGLENLNYQLFLQYETNN